MPFHALSQGGGAGLRGLDPTTPLGLRCLCSASPSLSPGGARWIETSLSPQPAAGTDWMVQYLARIALHELTHSLLGHEEELLHGAGAR